MRLDIAQGGHGTASAFNQGAYLGAAFVGAAGGDQQDLDFGSCGQRLHCAVKRRSGMTGPDGGHQHEVVVAGQVGGVGQRNSLLPDRSRTAEDKRAETAKEAHQQYEKVRGSVDASTKALEEQREAVLKELYAKADAVGVTHEYVDALLAQNQNAQSISEGLLDEAEKTERLTSVKSKLTSIMNDQKSAMLQNIAAGNSYYKLWDEQMPAALGNIKSLLSDGQKSWDAQSKSFILTSEAGRAASDALTALASNSNAYIESMIANGATTDEVSVKYNELSKNFGEAARQAGVADGDVQGLTQTLLGTPEEVKIKVEAQTLQAKTDLIGVIDAMQFLFPDGSREETRNMLVKMAMSGDLDPGELQRVLTELSDENHTIHVR